MPGSLQTYWPVVALAAENGNEIVGDVYQQIIRTAQRSRGWAGLALSWLEENGYIEKYKENHWIVRVCLTQKAVDALAPPSVGVPSPKVRRVATTAPPDFADSKPDRKSDESNYPKPGLREPKGPRSKSRLIVGEKNGEKLLLAFLKGTDGFLICASTGDLIKKVAQIAVLGQSDANLFISRLGMKGTIHVERDAQLSPLGISLVSERDVLRQQLYPARVLVS